MTHRIRTALALLLITLFTPALEADMDPLLWPGFQQSPWFNEQICNATIDPDVRLLIMAPTEIDPTLPTRVILFATPNGNTIEQTLGCAPADGRDWHFNIQHIAAQTRLLRTLRPDQTLILICIEANPLSWPTWRRRNIPDHASVRDVIRQTLDLLPVDDISLTLACHSGGGSLLFGFIDDGETIPPTVDQIIFLDANYSFNDSHGDKLVAWLRARDAHHLTVVAYDDRNITLNGKRVVGPTGGTFRATDRMLAHLEKHAPLTRSTLDEFNSATAFNERARFLVHQNPDNAILHTRLVGEMNGLLFAMSASQLAGPRVYEDWVQPLPFTPEMGRIPRRPADAPDGSALMRSLADKDIRERESRIADELLRGNIPDRLRAFERITLHTTEPDGTVHTAVIEVTPDYLAVGSDADSVRVPLSPMTAQLIADRFHCVLPTKHLVEQIHLHASAPLWPHPLVDDRERVGTFIEHNDHVDELRREMVTTGIVTGIKKDVVITPRLAESPGRVAIYGWHQHNGPPIQPLFLGHNEWYVDYSHGIRLIRRTITVDDVPMDIAEVLRDPALCGLLSDEGPIDTPRYRLPGPEDRTAAP